MRIYDGDFSVRSIIEDCTIKPIRAPALSFDGAAEANRIDLDLLNDRLRDLPIHEIRKRRQRMNTFYEEVLVSADPDRGIEFNALLMILAHYKVINDNKSLRLEEFLRRRARLQRVDEAVRRNVVVGFFDTLYWTRRFRRRIDSRKSARLTTVPSHDFEVPEIFVQEATDSPNHDDPMAGPITPIERLSFDGPEWPSPSRSAKSSRSTATELRDGSPGAHAASVLRNRGDSIQMSPSGSPTRSRAPTLQSHPSPAGSSMSGQWQFAEALQRPTSPGHLSGGDGTSDGDGGRSRANSSVAAQNVLDVLDNSAWGESIRRSFTIRRPSAADNSNSSEGRRGRAVRSSTVSHRRIS